MSPPGDDHPVQLSDASGPDAVHLSVMAITVCFQRFAGTNGTPGERGIAGVPFTALIDGNGGKRTQSGSTDARGRVVISVAPSERVQLKIFESTFDLAAIAPDNALKAAGVQRRLQMLGYEPGIAEGATPGTQKSVAFDAALCALQTDAGLPRTGVTKIMKADATAMTDRVASLIK